MIPIVSNGNELIIQIFYLLRLCSFGDREKKFKVTISGKKFFDTNLKV